MRFTRSALLLAVLAAVTGLAGCGSKDPASSGAPLPGATTSAGPEEESGTGLLDVCGLVSTDDVAALVGAPVTRSEVPGGGCSFDQDDPRAATIAYGATLNDEGTGGFDGAVSGVSGVLTGAKGAEVSGLGERAYVATGTMMGGSNTQASGVVLVHGTLVQVTLVQGAGLSAAKVKDLTVGALRLAAAP